MSIISGTETRPYISVGQLREALSGLDDNLLIVLAKDGEGNSFSPLSEVERNTYDPVTTWYGDVPGETPCLVLWPVN